MPPGRQHCRLSSSLTSILQACAGILDEEKSTAAVFQPVPFHYLEIAKVLFAEAKDCFGADMLKVRVIPRC